LGLGERLFSLRPYPRLGDVRAMVARSAFAQLDYSALKLLGTLAGLFLVFVTPVLGALFGPTRLASFAAWAIMFLMFQPMLRYYRRSPLWGLALPVIGTIYAAFTLDSAVQYWSGRGGMWKGRAQALDRPESGKPA
ncbi:MAG: glycosyltransferase, partial [Rhizomicrobium sp.]